MNTWLKEKLMLCADAVESKNIHRAATLLRRIHKQVEAHPAEPMNMVATHFADALWMRLHQRNPPEFLYSDYLLHAFHHYHTDPYLQYAHYAANQAIVDACSGSSHIHVIDFGIKDGNQWPPFMQVLNFLPGGQPELRLTAIGPPQVDAALQQVGSFLSQKAAEIGITFQFQYVLVNSLTDIELGMLRIRTGESVVVNSVFELHCLLSRPGAVGRVLDLIQAIGPRILTLVEQEANHNGPFMHRFNEALHYYSRVFESIESSRLNPTISDENVSMTQVYLGRQICNVVACHGVERVERHEKLVRWRERMGSAGFRAVRFGSNTIETAGRMLRLLTTGYKHVVADNGGCLFLGWDSMPLITTSAWKPTLSEADDDRVDLAQL